MHMENELQIRLPLSGTSEQGNFVRSDDQFMVIHYLPTNWYRMRYFLTLPVAGRSQVRIIKGSEMKVKNASIAGTQKSF